MTIPTTRGLVAAPFTPFNPDGSLHLEAIAPYARHLREVGVVGAFICGTTGEGASLTTAERRLVAERWVAVAPAGLRVLVHVGHTSLDESRAKVESLGGSIVLPERAIPGVGRLSLITDPDGALLSIFEASP